MDWQFENGKTNIKKILNLARKELKKNQIDTFNLDAEVLLSHVLKKDRVYLYAHEEAELSQKEIKDFLSLLNDRLKRVPVAHLIGEKEFRGLDFKVNSKVLMPRPDTEFLVESSIDLLKIRQEKSFILELCTGSGAVIISILKECENVAAIASDISDDALSIARENADKHKVSDRLDFLQGDLFDPLDKIKLKDKFDLIIANPPYIKTDDIKFLEQEVRYEPHIALDGGIDGLSFYKKILKEASSYLKKDGFLVFEIGLGQASDICLFAETTDFKIWKIIKDYADIERVLVFNLVDSQNV